MPVSVMCNLHVSDCLQVIVLTDLKVTENTLQETLRT